MNQKQKEYARSRVEVMYEKKKAEIERAYTKEEVKLSKEEKIDLILAGEAPMTRDKSYMLCNRYYAEDWFDFSEFEREKFVDNKTIETKLDPIRKLKTKAIDTIMLGGSEEALRIIQEFEKEMENE